VRVLGVVVKFNARLMDLTPGGAARGVNHGIADDEARAGPDRPAHVHVRLHPDGGVVIGAKNATLEIAVAVHVGLDADQAVTELVIVADLSATGEIASSRGRRRAEEAAIAELR